MKKLLFIATILLSVSFLLSAQVDSIKKSRIFKTWVSINNKPVKFTGVSSGFKFGAFHF
ncbi:MAG TPA: hypothetical protein VIK14_06640 [Ignavibacteria bacterium]